MNNTALFEFKISKKILKIFASFYFILLKVLEKSHVTKFLLISYFSIKIVFLHSKISLRFFFIFIDFQISNISSKSFGSRHLKQIHNWLITRTHRHMQFTEKQKKTKHKLITSSSYTRQTHVIAF